MKPFILSNKLCVYAAFVLLISACASTTGVKPTVGGVVKADADGIEQGWRNDQAFFQQAPLNRDDSWRYSAKVGITTDILREQANLIWQYADQNNHIRLFGPLGVGAIKIEFDQSGVELSDNKGILHRGNSAQQLLTDIVGWPLPIDALSHWLFVQPDLSLPYQYLLNEAGQVASIRQLGWQIDYSNYRQYNNKLLPRKLSAYKQFASSEQGAVTVKLITKAWQ